MLLSFIIPSYQREAYIERCIETVKKLHKQYGDKNILVTADSSTFLSELKEKSLPYVYVMPGKVVHLGFTADASKAVYMKSFLDMYMLSFSGTVYQATDKLLMRSTFPQRSALLGGAPYREIKVSTLS